MKKWNVFELCDKYQTELDDIIEDIAAESGARGATAKKEAQEYIIFCLLDCVRELLDKNKEPIKSSSGINFSWKE